MTVEDLNVRQSLVDELSVFLYFAHLIFAEIKIGELWARGQLFDLVDGANFVVAYLQNDKGFLIAADICEGISLDLVVGNLKL